MEYHIGLIKEPEFEKRLAFLPDEVKKLNDKLEVPVSVEKDYATHFGIDDEDYREAGAEVKERPEVFKSASHIISINDALKETDKPESDTAFIGIFNSKFFPERLDKYKKHQHAVYSLDLLPRTTLAQSMDVRSSMDALSGYKAVLKAAAIYPKVFPMTTTAAKTLQPIRVLVLGAGVAGLQAIATAKRLGGVVHAFDVRKAAGEEVRSLGAKFIEVEGNTDDKDSGGYAVEQSKDYKQKQHERIISQLSKTDLVICTANIPGKKAPVLVDEEGFNALPDGAIVIDLAAEQGGNCAMTKNAEVVRQDSKTVVGDSYLSRELSEDASKLLSANFFSFVKHLVKNGPENELVTACQATKND